MASLKRRYIWFNRHALLILFILFMCVLCISPWYDLKQAPREWFERFTYHLLTLGFVASSTDCSLFVRSVGFSLTYLLLYVDDIIVTGPDSSYISALKDELNIEFYISDMGNLTYFLGLEIKHCGSNIFVNQHKYLADLLLKAELAGAKSYSIPMSIATDFYAHVPMFDNPQLY